MKFLCCSVLKTLVRQYSSELLLNNQPEFCIEVCESCQPCILQCATIIVHSWNIGIHFASYHHLGIFYYCCQHILVCLNYVSNLARGFSFCMIYVQWDWSENLYLSLVVNEKMKRRIKLQAGFKFNCITYMEILMKLRYIIINQLFNTHITCDISESKPTDSILYKYPQNVVLF